jgi:hypothetical protein
VRVRKTASEKAQAESPSPPGSPAVKDPKPAQFYLTISQTMLAISPKNR